MSNLIMLFSLNEVMQPVRNQIHKELKGEGSFLTIRTKGDYHTKNAEVTEYYVCTNDQILKSLPVSRGGILANL